MKANSLWNIFGWGHIGLGLRCVWMGCLPSCPGVSILGLTIFKLSLLIWRTIPSTRRSRGRGLWRLNRVCHLYRSWIMWEKPVFGVFGFDYFGTGLSAKFEKGEYSYWPGPGFADNFYSTNQFCTLHRFALGTENADTMQIKLIINAIYFYKQHNSIL